MATIKVELSDIISMKSFLVEGVLLDFFNDENNTATMVVLKNSDIFIISITSSTLSKPKVRLISQLTHPIKDVLVTNPLGNAVMVFVIGDNEFDFNLVPKKSNIHMGYDELCVLESDVVNISNYKNVFPGYHLSNYESVREELNQGIEMPTYGLFRKISTPTGGLAIVVGESVRDSSKQTLIFEEIID